MSLPNLAPDTKETLSHVSRGDRSGSEVHADVNFSAHRSSICPPVEDSIQEMVEHRLPNFFRLYLNPAVAKACYCLSYLASFGRDPLDSGAGASGVFLANGHDEAISGALKLARYAQNKRGHSARTLLRGPRARISHFAKTVDSSGKELTFLPDVEELAFEISDNESRSLRASDEGQDDSFGVLIDIVDAAHPFRQSTGYASTPLRFSKDRIRIDVLGPNGLIDESGDLRATDPTRPLPDIVVFDNAWVDGQIPFSAFAAKPSLFKFWRRRSMSTFHSTTFQPNTISSLYFMRCLQALAPRVCERLIPQLDKIQDDSSFCAKVFQSLYSPSLHRLIRVTGFDSSTPIAAGHAIECHEATSNKIAADKPEASDDSVVKRSIIDCVAGVACSVRGHNPASFLEEVDGLGEQNLADALSRELDRTIGFSHFVLSGSGASAVEVGLKVGLATQPSRPWILALRGGFAGKTLLALTATDSERLRRGIDPLYPNTVFLDPHRDDCCEAFSEALDRFPIGVVQTELVQAVGGVRPVPKRLMDLILERRETAGYWLLVDEVQTGMYRTGEVTLSHKLGIEPDIMTLGKGTSDMMIPSALTVYSQRVHESLNAHNPCLVDDLAARHANPWGSKTALNTLRHCRSEGIASQVQVSAERFEASLKEKLRDIPTVADVRVYGLLIGVELKFPKSLHRFRSAIASFYLLSMLRHPTQPVLVGFCQNDRSVLKITPPLTITSQEIEAVCETIAEVLRRSPISVAMTGINAKIQSSFPTLASRQR